MIKLWTNLPEGFLFFPPNAACLIPADARGPAAHGACAAFGDGS